MWISHKRLTILEDNIRRVIADIRPQMLEKVIENWTSRLDYIRASRGSRMPEILFKMKSACKSTNKCRKCGKSHHTLLHFMTPREPNSSIPRDANNSVLSASAKVFQPVVFDASNTDTGPNPPNVNNPSITSCSGFDSNSQVLLCTALVNVSDSFGGTRLCRVLLDPGSQACLITNSCLERLGLLRKRTNVRISGLGASDT
ncbi:DUF1758 domain-containing protein [Trichonephila clavipes]|nr:DUF1758 domain-containing protein [Trichonephila clavipes]